MIGLENSRHFLNQSDAKLKPIATWSLGRQIMKDVEFICHKRGTNKD